MKIYNSPSIIHITVYIKNGKKFIPKHISFNERANGSSIFMTDDTALQAAIESHHDFNKNFFCDKESVDQQEGARHVDVQSDPGDPEIETITVADISSAQDLLVSKTGISRTKIRKWEDINLIASANKMRIVLADGSEGADEGTEDPE